MKGGGWIAAPAGLLVFGAVVLDHVNVEKDRAVSFGCGFRFGINYGVVMSGQAGTYRVEPPSDKLCIERMGEAVDYGWALPGGDGK